MIEILPGVFVTPAKAIEIHASISRVIAAQLEPEPALPRDTTNLIADILDVWPEGQAKAGSSLLAHLLAKRFAFYDTWDGADVSRALRPYRRQVWVNNRNIQGFWRKDLEGVLRR